MWTRRRLDSFLYEVAQNFGVFTNIQKWNKNIKKLWWLVSFSRPIQWYHSHADPIWPDGITYYCSMALTYQGAPPSTVFSTFVQNVRSESKVIYSALEELLESVRSWLLYCTLIIKRFVEGVAGCLTSLNEKISGCYLEMCNWSTVNSIKKIWVALGRPWD